MQVPGSYHKFPKTIKMMDIIGTHRRCSQGNTCVTVSFLIKLQAVACELQVFSCEFCDIFLTISF